MIKFLPLLLPLAALALVVTIGVSIGLTNIWFQDAFDSKTAPVISAGSITIIIMAVAIYLSMKSPDPSDQIDE